MQNKNDFSRVGLYMRLSRDDEKMSESLSIENQRIILQKYVAERNGVVVDEYIDDGWSGTNFDRPDVKRLLDDAQSGKIDTIIVKDLSRFGRNYIQVGQYIDYIFPAYGIRFIAISDNIDTAERNSTAMDMMPIMNVFNEWHAANTSKKVRSVKEASWKAGKYADWGYPYGYKAGTDEKRTAVIDEPAAQVVRRIFDLRANGESSRGIARILTDEGIPNPATYFTRLDGKKLNKKFSPYWCQATVLWILSNPVYIGTLVQHKTTRVSYKNHKVIYIPENEQAVRENAHEPIVTREIWDKVQAMKQSVSRGRKDKNNKVHALSGFLVCDGCGKKLKLVAPSKKRKGQDYYVMCRTYKDLGNKYCTAHRMKERELEYIVLDDIRSMLSYVKIDEEKAKERFLRERAKSTEQNRYSDEKRLAILHNRLVELDAFMRSAFEDKVLKKIPESVCINLCEKYQSEKESVEAEIAEIQERLDSANQDRNEVEEYIRRLKRYGNCEVLTREMCLQLINFISVGEKDEEGNREIHIYYKFISKQELKKYQESKLKSIP